MTLRPMGQLTMTLFFLSLVCLRANKAVAQGKLEKDIPPITAADFRLPASPAIDSNSTAVILHAFGDIRFVGNRDGWFSHVYKFHERIKILNKKAFDEAGTIRVVLHTPLEDPEKIDKITGVTYSLENGSLTAVQLDKKDIFTDRPNKEYTLVKWSMPALKEGAIIDYSYTITSDYNFHLPTWQFQSARYPVLLSELQIDVPQTLMYVTIKQGIHAYAVDKGSEGSESFRIGRKDGGDLMVSAITERHQWAMKDVPAFQEEPFLACEQNYVDKVDFQLARTYDGEDYHDYYNSWKQATTQLLERDDFGHRLDDDDPAIQGLVQQATEGTSGDAAMAKAMYYYVTDHFTCNDFDDKYIRTSLSDVIKKHSGTVGDINLLLISMLRRVALKADPVVLSTREYGFNLASYPDLSRLNYVIVRLVLNGKIVYLDAAHPKLGFGELDESCYNGHARIISNTDSASVYFDADSLTEKSATIVFIQQTDKGVEGTWSSLLGPRKSYDLRDEVGRNGQDAYFKDLQRRYGDDLIIGDGGIDSLDQLEKPVKIHYSFMLKQPDGEGKMYVNPFIGAGVRENPFKAAERKYPVEMPYGRDELFVFSMQVPEGYSVEEMPKALRASLNGNDGSFEYLVGNQNGMIQVRCHLKLNKANFFPDDYSSLRNFFALVVSKEAESIVLKKN